MMDLSLLRMLKHKDDFYKVRGRIPDTAIDAQTRAILDDYGKYFEKFPEHSKVELEVFLPLFRGWHTGLKDDKRQVFETILTNAQSDVAADTRSEIMRTLLELRLATTIANVLAKFDEGELDNLYGRFNMAIDEFKADVGIRDIKFIDTDIDDLLHEEMDMNGVQFRLQCLNESMRPLRGGDFGIIAGRPDRGKTTFISSEVTYFAPQLPEDRNVLWLNNEGPGSRIVPRLYQSAIGATRTQLLQLSEKRVLKAAYRKFVGRLDRIRVVDIHNMDNFSVEQIIEQNKAGVVIYDMIDNIRGFGDAARTDLGLEKMYQWGRLMAVKHNHIGLATSQISADGDGLQYPTMSMLKDSKTGKQGACDFIIMIGASNDPGYNSMRWIGVPKNKLRRDGGLADPRAPVKYEPMRARYDDILVTAEDAEKGTDDKDV